MKDPFEPVNRMMFDVAGVMDAVLLKPLAEIYVGLVPQFVRTPIANFLGNLDEPINLANDIFQLDWNAAGNTAARLGINTTVGLGGFFDPATGWGFPNQPTDFGLTLASYGTPPGYYLYLPVYGPSTVRDGVGTGVDFFMTPLSAMYFDRLETLTWIRRGADAINTRAQVLGALDQIQRTSVDAYSSIRSLYLQNRASKIRKEGTNVDDLPDLDALDWDSEE